MQIFTLIYLCNEKINSFIIYFEEFIAYKLYIFKYFYFSKIKIFYTIINFLKFQKNTPRTFLPIALSRIVCKVKYLIKNSYKIII